MRERTGSPPSPVPGSKPVSARNAEQKLHFARRQGVVTAQDNGFDARQAARDELGPDGRALALMLENIVAEAAQQIRYIRGKLKAKADTPKGLSGRTLVEWHKAEAMAMSRAKAITALEGNKGRRGVTKSCCASSEASRASAG